MSKNIRYLFMVVIIILVLIPIAMFLKAGFESVTVIDKGELLPYVKGYSIYKIRVFDKYEFYVEPDDIPDESTLNAYILVGIAFISLTILVIMRALGVPSSDKRRLLFLFMCIGTNYLAADEYIGIHETLGHNMQFLTSIVPFAKRPDDVVILSYSIPMFVFLYFFYRYLLVSKIATTMFIAAVIFYVFAAVSDGLILPMEEILEVLSSASIIVGVLSLGVHYIEEIFQSRIQADGLETF